MRKYIVLALLFISLSLTAQIVEKKTFVYSVKGTDTLRLDKYNDPSVDQKKPCLIFMFGGGFVRGERDNNSYLSYFDHLVKKGYVVISIDYRLGLKNAASKVKGLNDAMTFIQMLNNSISIAVEDLFDATNYVLKNADEWNINRNFIIANGSSAGAISVLQAEYEISNNTKLANKLPEGFNYAGIVSFAGAIFSMQGLTWKSKPVPILLFHGDADRNVPYDKLQMGPIGFYGSKHIAEQLEEMKSPYNFFDFENAAHEIASTPMSQYVDEINSFVEKYIIKRRLLQIHSKVRDIDKPELDKDFEIMDYIKSNFGGR